MKAVVPQNRYVAFWSIALIGCLIDLVTKHAVFNWLGAPPDSHVHWVWPGYVGLQTSLNQGALFGLGQGKVALFAALSVVALVAIPLWLFRAGAAVDWLLCIALSGVTAGILGNLYDRLGMHGLTWNVPPHVGAPVYAVRDFILLQINNDWRWPNFNVADSLLVGGAGLLLWHAIRPSASAQPRPDPSDRQPSAAPGSG